jgi:hypothetical protein
MALMPLEDMHGFGYIGYLENSGGLSAVRPGGTIRVGNIDMGGGKFLGNGSQGPGFVGKRYTENIGLPELKIEAVE